MSDTTNSSDRKVGRYFTSRQLTFIQHQAEEVYVAQLGELNDEVIGAARVLDDVRYNRLPEDWQPDHAQQIWLWDICLAFEAFWRDLLANPNVSSDDIVMFGDVRELVISIRRNLIHLVH